MKRSTFLHHFAGSLAALAAGESVVELVTALTPEKRGRRIVVREMTMPLHGVEYRLAPDALRLLVPSEFDRDLQRRLEAEIARRQADELDRTIMAMADGLRPPDGPIPIGILNPKDPA